MRDILKQCTSSCVVLDSVHLSSFVPPIKNLPGIKKLNYHYPADIIIIIIINSSWWDLVVKGSVIYLWPILLVVVGQFPAILCSCLHSKAPKELRRRFNDDVDSITINLFVYRVMNWTDQQTTKTTRAGGVEKERHRWTAKTLELNWLFDRGSRLIYLQIRQTHRRRRWSSSDELAHLRLCLVPWERCSGLRSSTCELK